MSNSKLPIRTIDPLYTDIGQIIEQSRYQIYQAVNFNMVQAYWNIGKGSVEEEQNGEQGAECGNDLIKQVSIRLSKTYGICDNFSCNGQK